MPDLSHAIVGASHDRVQGPIGPNRSPWRDVTLDPKLREIRFRMFVHPATTMPGGDLKLELQMLDRGEWITHTTDRLMFPKSDE